jgi:hypothetical protein
MAEPFTLDGRLEEQAWRDAPPHPLTRLGDQSPLEEPGTVRFAWDDEHFYAAFDLVDRDVVQEATEDQQHHYRTGDVAELFLKPAERPHYWEFYVTPNGLKTAFFYPGRGRLGLPSALQYTSGIRVAAHVDGSLNDWGDTDRGWTAEVAIPLAELSAAGVRFAPDVAWTAAAGRYNFGVHLNHVELSSFPPMTRNFHQHESWAPLVIESPHR